MNKTKRSLLLYELIAEIKKIDPTSKSEVMFNAIMPTKRKFRADFYIPKYHLIIEVNGGQWVTGRHTRGGIGYESDLEKLNTVAINGFNVLQYTYEMLQRGDHLRDLHQISLNKLTDFLIN